ncbi:MAG: rRNA maturation RNase YbeY [Bacilli bacterium]
MIELDFINDYPEDLANYRGIFQRLAEKTRRFFNYDQHYLLEVRLVDQEMMRELNRKYRKIDAPTDVLSFAFLEKEELTKVSPVPQMLGTIVIAVDQAQAQAETYQHSLRREMKFLFLHGLLHLFGYDHQTVEEEKIMRTLQTKILGARKGKNDEKRTIND